MDNEKYKNKYRIASARAQWHDYGGGAYFITVCTKNREHSFGEINNGQMELTPLGVYLSENLENITEHYPYANIPLHVVMPNHWHAIVYIDSEKTPYPRRINKQIAENEVRDEVMNDILTETQRNGGDFVYYDYTDTDRVETRRATSLHGRTNNPQSENSSDAKNKQMQDLAHKQGWLSVAIGGVKSAITKFANQNQLIFSWQARFHDHIIRDSGELNRIVWYIDNNVNLWDDDCFNEQNKNNE